MSHTLRGVGKSTLGNILLGAVQNHASEVYLAAPHHNSAATARCGSLPGSRRMNAPLNHSTAVHTQRFKEGDGCEVTTVHLHVLCVCHHFFCFGSLKPEGLL